MSEDHLSNETSIFVELTDKGIKSSARSRAVAAMDRLVGSVVDLGGAWFEGFSARRRARTDGERKLIEAAANYGVDRMNVDDEFAKRAFDNQFRKVVQQQLNKDGVVAAAIENLRLRPPTDQEAIAGPSQVGDEFMNRFETYAEGATTDQLRERWGAILACEIRRPGTFNQKVLRVVDELDSEAAKAFENLMPFRVGDCFLKCALPELSLSQRISLISAGLIVDPGFTGHRHSFVLEEFDGQPRWASSFGNLLVTLPKDTEIGHGGDVICQIDGTPFFDVIILTDVGNALCHILPSDEEALGLKYAEMLERHIRPARVVLFKEASPRTYELVSD